MSIEQSDQLAAAVAKTSKRITLDDITALIVDTKFFYDETLTICILKLRNGFKIVGESACVDPVNYNKELGEKFAREDALRKVWPLEAYCLANKE